MRDCPLLVMAIEPARVYLFGATLQNAPLRVREAQLPYEPLAPSLLNRCRTKLAISGYPPCKEPRAQGGLGH